MEIPKYTAMPEKTIITRVPQNFPLILLTLFLRYLTDKKIIVIAVARKTRYHTICWTYHSSVLDSSPENHL